MSTVIHLGPDGARVAVDGTTVAPALDGWDRLIADLSDPEIALADVQAKARTTEDYRAAIRRDDLVTCGRLDADGIARAHSDRTYGHRSPTVERMIRALEAM